MTAAFVTRALLSGLIIALIALIGRKAPAAAALVASLPLISILGMIWLWRDTGDAARVADFALASSLYVLASLPAFSLLAVLLRKGYAFPTAMAAFLIAGWLGYALMQVAGRRWGWPV